MLHRDPRRPSEQDLAALADGSLADPRRSRVEALVAGSPELQAVIREQRDALEAVHRAAVPAPDGLRARVAPGGTTAAPHRGSRFIPALALPGAVAVVVAAVVLTTISSSTPTIAQAASLASRSPTAAAPAGNRGELLPRLRAAGLPFPYWEDRFGWRASGVRHDSLAGRSTTTVFYRYASHLVVYTIVSGPALASPARARVSVRNGTRVELFAVSGRPAVTWLRRGHTCVLSGTGVSGSALLRLAAWHGRGTIPY